MGAAEKNGAETMTNGPATEKQIGFIESLAKRAGYRHSSQAVRRVIGKNPTRLSKSRASAVIESLQAEIKAAKQERPATPKQRQIADVKARQQDVIQRRWDAQEAGDLDLAAELDAEYNELLDEEFELLPRPRRAPRMARHCLDEGVS